MCLDAGAALGTSTPIEEGAVFGHGGAADPGQESTSPTPSGHEVSVLDDETREGAPDAKATDGQGDSPDNVESLVAGMISSDGTPVAGCPEVATLVASNDDSTAEGKSTAGGPGDEAWKELEVGYSEGVGDQPNNSAKRYQDGIESMERDSSRDGCEPNNISACSLMYHAEVTAKVICCNSLT